MPSLRRLVCLERSRVLCIEASRHSFVLALAGRSPTLQLELVYRDRTGRWLLHAVLAIFLFFKYGHINFLKETVGFFRDHGSF